MHDQLDQLWNLIAIPQNLIIAYCIALGYVIKKIPAVPNQYIELIVTLFSVLFAQFLFTAPTIPFVKAAYGLIYAVVSFKLYDWVFSRIEGLISPKVLPLLLAAGLSVTLVACVGLTPNFSALPATATPAEKQKALAADAYAKLADPSVQKGVRNTLVFAGNLALQKAVSDEDRTAIKNQMYAWATAFETLATGKVVTASEIDAAAHSFNTDFSVTKYADFLNAANGAWQLFYPQLKIAGDAELTRQWLLVLSGAAREVAGGK
jgi:hypothetical protein